MSTDQILTAISDGSTVPAAIIAGGLTLYKILALLLDKYPAWRRTRMLYSAFKIYLSADADEAARQRALEVIKVFAPELLPVGASPGG